MRLTSLIEHLGLDALSLLWAPIQLRCSISVKVTKERELKLILHSPYQVEANGLWYRVSNVSNGDLKVRIQAFTNFLHKRTTVSSLPSFLGLIFLEHRSNCAAHCLVCLFATIFHLLKGLFCHSRLLFLFFHWLWWFLRLLTLVHGFHRTMLDEIIGIVGEEVS